MRLVLFGEDFRLGIVTDSGIVDASSIANQISFSSPQEMMRILIENFEAHRADLEKLAAKVHGIPTNTVRLRAPLPQPARLVCMAVNYMEGGTRNEPAPINAFNKSSSSVIGNGDTINLPNVPATIFEHEAELGIVIKGTTRKVSRENAYDHVFGYVNFIDVSCRGLGPASADSFFIGKSSDTFGPMGPVLVTADEVLDPQDLQVRLSVNDTVRQDFSTSDMAHKIPELLEWISGITTLASGDLVSSGTNHSGLGALQNGDNIRMEISDFGPLDIWVKDNMERSWSRETRAQKEAN